MKRQKQNKPRTFAKAKAKKQLVLGVTGGFGSGKTTVSGIFKSFGAYVIDADKLAHSCITRASPAYKKIIHTFGTGVLKKNRMIDRRKLAAIVFNDINLLIKLNNIVHPQVIRIIKNKINSWPAKVIVLDAPLLIEAGLNNLVDKLIVVKITRAEQLKRAQNKTSLTEAEILKRIKSQLPLSKKLRLADFVIDNSGKIGETARQVKNIWKNMNLPPLHSCRMQEGG